MRWSQSIAAYPKQWVITEAREFESEYDRRFGRDWYPISAHGDPKAALSAYVEYTREVAEPRVLLVNTAVPGGLHEVAACSGCGLVGLLRDCRRLAREPFCKDCYRKLKNEPRHQVAAHCRQDGSDIYRVWIDQGAATAELCPECVKRRVRTD